MNFQFFGTRCQCGRQLTAVFTEDEAKEILDEGKGGSAQCPNCNNIWHIARGTVGTIVHGNA